MIKFLVQGILFSSMFILCLLGVNIAYAGSFLFTSWNVEWLASEQNSSKYIKQRNKEDIQILRKHYKKISPDILAFQEVDSVSAIKAVVGDEYMIFLSDRSLKQYKNMQFGGINQYTGFAVHRGLAMHKGRAVSDPKDLRLFTHQHRKLRFASYLIFTPSDNREIHMLSIHLKAGCYGNYRNNSNCRTLKEQALMLNQWLVDRVEQNHSFIIAGDFNHPIALSNNWLYAYLTKGVEKEVVIASKNTLAECIVRSNKDNKKTHQFTNVIDHILVSADLKFSQAKQSLFSKEEVLTYQMSDHCPVSSHISF